MKKLFNTILIFTIIFTFSCSSKPDKGEEKAYRLPVEFSRHDAEQRIDVMIDGKLFTSLKWQEGIYKPVLHPIINASGTIVTRGFPLDPRPGERPDHRHHVGNWLNYGDVNGFDFWGNGHSGERSSNGGEILLSGVDELIPGDGEGTMITKGSWVDPDGKEMLSEKTEYHVIAEDSLRIIDRITTLAATGDTIFMNDTKEGMFAVRVARQLELPSDGDITVLDVQGNPTKVSAMSNEGITGNYLSSEGVTGSEVWGTRAKWMDLCGNIGDEKISIVICDHPKNPGYPTYWHARGYGLFSANPLGAKDFTKGAEEMNFSIPSGESLTFRYRLVISSNAHLTAEEINKLAEEFSEKH
jgi:hypothetical protein